MEWLFEITNYREVVRKMIREADKVYGYRTLLARAAGCQQAYLSQVLAETAHLTPEHGAGLCDFWQFGQKESEYFLNLVLLGRAGSESLRQKLLRQGADIAQEAKATEKRLVQSESQDQRAALLYYSDWRLSAVHVLISIEQLQTAESLAKHLSLGLKEVRKFLFTLEEVGLASHQGERWMQTTKNLHAPDSSAVAKLHHKNWRLRALAAVEEDSREALHYTAPCTLTEKDYLEIRHLLARAIQKSRDIVGPSKEHLGACLTVDWFKF
jgi:uncharacterized protein (TIGR02147 family)